MSRIFLKAARLHDGLAFRPETGLLIEAGRVAGFADSAPEGWPQIEAGPGVIAPGLVDCQVNGGGGSMLSPDPASVRAMLEAHARLGATTILPTLITDTFETTRAVIDTAIRLCALGTPGLGGLHLEGPHLDPRRAGAHDPELIRPMEAEDLALYLEAAARLPALFLTLAPESASLAQIRALTEAGVRVFLGHSDASAETAEAAFEAGAMGVTHLFNAMSQLGHRSPGLVGAALARGVAAGVIADGVHVADAALKLALLVRPEALFLVSDAMAVAGSDAAEFRLGGRRILRGGGRLVLENGTLAGADLSLPQAIGHLVRLGQPLGRAIAMASGRPGALLGTGGGRYPGRLMPGGSADLVQLGPTGALLGVWRAGVRL